MKIAIASRLMEASSNKLVLGTLIASIKVTPASEEFQSLLAERAANHPINIAASQGVQAVKETYRKLGKTKLSEFKGSNEALLLRLQKNQGIPNINNVVNINNLLSIDSERSVGSYDLDKLSGDIIFRPGNHKEEYTATKKRSIDLTNLPLLADEQGPFGSPTSDSDRALIREETKNLMLIIFSFDGEAHLEAQLNQASALLEKYAAATNIQKFMVHKTPVEFFFPSYAEVREQEGNTNSNNNNSSQIERFTSGRHPMLSGIIAPPPSPTIERNKDEPDNKQTFKMS